MVNLVQPCWEGVSNSTTIRVFSIGSPPARLVSRGNSGVWCAFGFNAGPFSAGEGCCVVRVPPFSIEDRGLGWPGENRAAQGRGVGEDEGDSVERVQRSDPTMHSGGGQAYGGAVPPSLG